MKHIDAEKLKKELYNVRQDWLSASTGLEVEEVSAALCTAEDVLDSIDDIIDSLQQEQPEVDLEKEISTWIPAHVRGGDNEVWKDTKNAVIEWGGIVARHFYELGRNARKEENI